MCVAHCMCVRGCECRGATSGACTLADPWDTGLAVGTAVGSCSWSRESEGHEPWRKTSPGPRVHSGSQGRLAQGLKIFLWKQVGAEFPVTWGLGRRARAGVLAREPGEERETTRRPLRGQEHSGDQPSTLGHRELMKTKGEAAGWPQTH